MQGGNTCISKLSRPNLFQLANGYLASWRHDSCFNGMVELLTVKKLADHNLTRISYFWSKFFLSMIGVYLWRLLLETEMYQVKKNLKMFIFSHVSLSKNNLFVYLLGEELFMSQLSDWTVNVVSWNVHCSTGAVIYHTNNKSSL